MNPELRAVLLALYLWLSSGDAMYRVLLFQALDKALGIKPDENDNTLYAKLHDELMEYLDLTLDGRIN